MVTEKEGAVICMRERERFPCQRSSGGGGGGGGAAIGITLKLVRISGVDQD